MTDADFFFIFRKSQLDHNSTRQLNSKISLFVTEFYQDRRTINPVLGKSIKVSVPIYTIMLSPKKQILSQSLFTCDREADLCL